MLKTLVDAVTGRAASDSGARLKKAVEECVESKKEAVAACKATREAAIKARSTSIAITAVCRGKK